MCPNSHVLALLCHHHCHHHDCHCHNYYQDPVRGVIHVLDKTSIVCHHHFCSSCVAVPRLCHLSEFAPYRALLSLCFGIIVIAIIIIIITIIIIVIVSCHDCNYFRCSPSPSTSRMHTPMAKMMNRSSFRIWVCSCVPSWKSMDSWSKR